MSDEALLRMVYVDSGQYRVEALTYARAEIARRGITIEDRDEIVVQTGQSLRLAAVGTMVWMNRRTLAFAVGWAVTLIVFAWANYESQQKMYLGLEHCFDCLGSFGFPFHLGQAGGFAGPRSPVLWFGLIADVAIAFIVSGVVGWLLKSLTIRLTR